MVRDSPMEKYLFLKGRKKWQTINHLQIWKKLRP